MLCISFARRSAKKSAQRSKPSFDPAISGAIAVHLTLESPEAEALKTAVVWFRRDLRITDNSALLAARRRAEQVVPVYVLSDWAGSHRWTGPNRQQFLCGCLSSLARNLAAVGGRLIIRRGSAVPELAKLVNEVGAQAIFFNRDGDPFGRRVEADLCAFGENARLEITGFHDGTVHEPGEVLNSSGEPFRVFTAYARAWKNLGKRKPQGRVRALKVPEDVASLPLPTLETWGLRVEADVLEGGEKAARTRMKRFIEGGLASYGQLRNFLAGEFTSRLSQDLRFGLLSIRELLVRCHERASQFTAPSRKNAEKFISELIWREFYFSILWHFPEVLETEFNPKFRAMQWPGKREHFDRWRTGETGFPIVDAAMRQLAKTGFMPNRARMIVAMFLTKDLLLDWRLGESYFMQKLTDGEIASNNGGWQWSAGTGADAAPYFRILNPWTQSARCDPEGEYVKQWVPELRSVAAQCL
ncbi:MAG TPA: deoxyribodipyrimidine photo-lyase, partial [Terrimicrobiaceae bacterium]|nr:deoxyribodipyrimidine photo-lyase [Terrimicrobiaceae bacterium]